MYVRPYIGITAMTKLFYELTPPCFCITSTENITDIPSGKYGVIVILKFNVKRAGATLISKEGKLYTKGYNYISNEDYSATKWIEK